MDVAENVALGLYKSTMPSFTGKHFVSPGTSTQELGSGIALTPKAYAARSCASAYFAAKAALRGDAKATGIAASEAFTYAGDAIDGIPRVTDNMLVDSAFTSDISHLQKAAQPWPNNELGDPIDPSDQGSMGPLWPSGIPQRFAWFFPEPVTHTFTFIDKATAEVVPGLATQIQQADPEPLISAYFDNSGFTEEEISLCLSYLSEVYREQGGVGLKVVNERTLTPSAVGVTT